MKAIVPDFKKPGKVCEEQLAELDAYIKANWPEAKLEEGLKYARWAVFEGLRDFAWLESDPFKPNYVFRDKIFGRPTTILMWLNFFD